MSRGLTGGSAVHPRDVLAMSLQALFANKLRSILTLVGIVAGVASIIGVMTGISVIQAALEREMSVLGAQTFQVQKWPAGGFGGAEARRKAMKRPPLTLENAQAIRDQVTSADLVGSEIWEFGYSVSYGGKSTNPNVSICGETHSKLKSVNTWPARLADWLSDSGLLAR